jgi:hypothetical protein
MLHLPQSTNMLEAQGATIAVGQLLGRTSECSALKNPAPTPALGAASARPQGPVIGVDRFRSLVRPDMAEPGPIVVGRSTTVSSRSRFGKADAQRRDDLVAERPRPRTTAPFAHREAVYLRHASETIARSANRRAPPPRVLSDRQHALQHASARTRWPAVILLTAGRMPDRNP